MKQNKTGFNKPKNLFKSKNFLTICKLVAACAVLLGSLVYLFSFLNSPQKSVQASNIISPSIAYNQDSTKKYVAEENNVKVIDVATNRIERIVYDDFLIGRIAVGNNKLFAISERPSVSLFPAVRNDNNVKTLNIYDSTTLQLLQVLPPQDVFNSTVGLQIQNLVVSPDGTKLYIAIENFSDVPFIGIRSTTSSLVVIDLNTLDRIETVISTSIRYDIQNFSNNGKQIILRDNNQTLNFVDTFLVNTSDIDSFNCISPTNSLGSTVTCTVNTLSNVRGLVKFDVGLESCTAYFPSSGANTASCTYTANNVQTSSITVNPSFGNPSTNGSLTINGGANDITISASNIVSNNNCTVSGNAKITSTFDCSFSLTASSSNSYVLPTQGIKVGLNGVTTKSDSCTITNNGTSNVRLNCKNIPTVGATPGNKNIEAFVNNSNTGNIIGNIKLTDGLLVNSTLDTLDNIPGDGYCGDVNGVCTLRAAVMEANAVFDRDKITIPAGVYQLTIAPTDTPNVTENKGAVDGDLDVTSDIDFIGASKDTTFIQAGSNNTNGIDRVFHIFNTNVNFSDLTVRYGRAENITVPEYQVIQGSNLAPLVTDKMPRNGGGIYYQKFKDFNFEPENALYIERKIALDPFNSTARYTPEEGGRSVEFETSLNLANVNLLDNFAGNSGGGIYNSAMFSTFNEANISNNSSGLFGGGVSRAGVADRQTFRFNVFVSDPNTFVETSSTRIIKSLPIDQILDKDTLTLKNTLISQNQSTDGGGLYHDRARKIFVEEDTRILSNTATKRGGGIYNSELVGFSDGGITITITGATINSNTANQGGGIYNESGHVETLLGNLTNKNTTIQYNNGVLGSAWFALSGLSELTNTSVYENNTQNPNFDYNTARVQTSTIRVEGGELNINNSLLLGNWGRGVEFNGTGANNPSTIKNSTIADTSGRAVTASNGSGPSENPVSIDIENSTIARNNASGIYLGDDKAFLKTQHVTLTNNSYGVTVNPANLVNARFFNTLIANSFFKNCADISGNDLTSELSLFASNNMANNSDCDLFSNFRAEPDAGTTLGALAFNGGPTLTVALLEGNPAIDAGFSGSLSGQPIGLFNDQRGFARPAGNGPDIGAFETDSSQLEPTTAVDDNYTTLITDSVDFNVLDNDIEGTFAIDRNSVNVDTSTSKGNLNNNGDGNFTYTPDPSQFTSGGPETDTFTYYFLDNNGVQSNTATVTITVNPVVTITQPIANPDTTTTPESTPITINVLANDTNSTNICVGSISGVINGTATITTVDGVDQILFTPTTGYFGDVTFSYTACSDVVGTNPSEPTTVTVSITQVNPIAVGDTATVNENESVTIDVLANDNDPSGQALTICSPLSTPTNGTITKTTVSGTERIIFTPTTGYSGTTTFTYTACDPAGNASNVATVTITVNPVVTITQPIANPDTTTTPESTPITIPVLTNDTDTTNICIGSVTLASGSTANGIATITTVDGIDQILFTPTTGYFGDVTFSYTACSDVVGTNPSAPATVTVSVTQVNPIAVNDTASVNQNQTITINVLSNDSDPSGQTLTICSPLSTPTNGTTSKTTLSGVEQIIFTPTIGYSGTTTFTYTACDPAGNASNVATVSVTVVPNTPAPVITQNIQLTLYKEKPDTNIVVNEPLKIQADIKNPNTADVAKVETIINIDTTKLDFVSGSARQGTIPGTKYSSVFKLLDSLSIPVEAATSVTIEVLSASQLKVTALNMQPNETINIVFDVLPKASIQNSISGNTSIIDPVTNQPLATANAEVTIRPTSPVFTIIRTGGFGISLGLVVIFGFGLSIYFVWRKKRIDITN